MGTLNGDRDLVMMVEAKIRKLNSSKCNNLSSQSLKKENLHSIYLFHPHHLSSNVLCIN